MRSRRWGVLLGVLTFITATKSAPADDDPIRNGVKLSGVIAQFQAAKGAGEKNVNERSRLTQTIAMFESPQALAFLGAVLREDPAPLVRVNAAYALNQLGAKAKPIVPDLIAALKDTKPAVRAAVAHALGMIGPDAKTAAPDLLALLKDPAQDAQVRAASAASLTHIKGEPKDITPALNEAIKDKDIQLRLACASALYRLDKANAKIAVPVFREGLKSKDTNVLMGAVINLKPFGSDAKEAIPDLIELVKTNGVGGYYAPDTLGAIPEAEAALLAALKDPDKELQRAAATALKKAFPEAAKKAGLIK